MQVDNNENSKIPNIDRKTSDENSVSSASEQNTSMSGLFNDMNWLIPVSTAPTKRPLQPMGMIILYINGATIRLYVYDVKGNAWHYTALT